jgi:hypothetical protein
MKSSWSGRRQRLKFFNDVGDSAEVKNGDFQAQTIKILNILA